MSPSASPSPSAATGVLLVRPDHFAHNPETAATNAFGQATERSPDALRRAALEEFEGLVAALRGRGVSVEVVDGVAGAPDAVFPNNWVSFHRDGSAVLYPMESATRRLEVRPELVERLQAQRNAGGDRPVHDLTGLAAEGRYLEGTGSMVLDRAHRVAYACRSPRTDARALDRFCEALDYAPVLFDATDAEGRAIYHTNVLMAVGTGFAVVTSEALAPLDRDAVVGRLADTGRLLIELDRSQMNAFAANLLELRGGLPGAPEPLIVLSARAHRALRPDQKAALGTCADLVPVELDTFETVGGGSARCMITELEW